VTIQEFIVLARKGKLEEIKKIIPTIITSASPAKRLKGSKTLLHINDSNAQSARAIDAAVKAGKKEVVELLIANGAKSILGSFASDALKHPEVYEICIEAFGMDRMKPDLMYFYDFEKEKNWKTIVYILEHEKTNNETRVSFLSRILNRGSYEETKYVYDLCDDISIKDNQLAAGIYDKNRNFNFGSHKFKDERIKEMIINDKKVLAKAMELSQLDLLPNEIKDTFLF